MAVKMATQFVIAIVIRWGQGVIQREYQVCGQAELDAGGSRYEMHKLAQHSWIGKSCMF